MKLENAGQMSKMAFSMPRADQRYLVMRAPATGTLVSVYAAFETFDHFPQTADNRITSYNVCYTKLLR